MNRFEERRQAMFKGCLQDVSGEEVTLDQSNGDPLRNYKIHGNTHVETEEASVNLFNFNSTELVNKNDVVRTNFFVKNSEGELQIKLTMYSGAAYLTNNSVIKAGSCTISFEAYVPSSDGKKVLYIGVREKQQTSHTSTTTALSAFDTWERVTKTFTIDSAGQFDILIQSQSTKGNIESGLRVKNIQVEQGETATDYVPYSPAMPSPERPSTAVSLGENHIPAAANAYTVRTTANGSLIFDTYDCNVKSVTGKTVKDAETNTLKNSYFKGIKSTGKNLFNPNNFGKRTPISGVTVEYLQDEDCFLLNGATVNGNWNTYYAIDVKLLAGKRYTLVAEYVSGNVTIETSPSDSTTKIFVQKNTVQWMQTTLRNYRSIASWWSNTPTVVDGDVCNRFWFYVHGSVTFTNYKVRVQLEQANTATDYEPYTEDTLTLESPIELTEYDTVYPEENKVERQSNTIVFDGTESWTSGGVNPGVVGCRVSFDAKALPVSSNGIIGCLKSNLYEPTTADRTYLGNNGASLDTAGILSIYDSNFTTVEEWKAHLAELYANGNPLTVTYKTATATEETISFNKSSYTAWKDGTETVEQGDVDNSKYGAISTITQDYGAAKIAIENEVAEVLKFTTLDLTGHEPLRKWGDYADYIDFKKKCIVRNLYRFVVPANAIWSDYTRFTTVLPSGRKLKTGLGTKTGYSNYYGHTSYYSGSTGITPGIYNTWGVANSSHVAISTNRNEFPTAEDYSAFVQQLRDNGKPLEFTYVLETPYEEPIDLPEVGTEEYTNLIRAYSEYDGQIMKPSNLEVQYYTK